jgi:hypothetical protein
VLLTHVLEGLQVRLDEVLQELGIPQTRDHHAHGLEELHLHELLTAQDEVPRECEELVLVLVEDLILAVLIQLCQNHM